LINLGFAQSSLLLLVSQLLVHLCNLLIFDFVCFGHCLNLLQDLKEVNSALIIFVLLLLEKPTGIPNLCAQPFNFFASLRASTPLCKQPLFCLRHPTLQKVNGKKIVFEL
jgi:hypothetical protein